MNKELKQGFTQVVVWPGTICPDNQAEDFEGWIAETFKCRAQYLEQVETTEASEDGSPRVDLLFAIHTQDLPRFAVPRLGYGMRWIEDVYGNGQGHIYPERIKEYGSW